jgi:hypothetical protein
VQAGHSGAFGLVVGVNRSPAPGALTQAGAHVEVSDLSDVRLSR